MDQSISLLTNVPEAHKGYLGFAQVDGNGVTQLFPK